MQQEPETMMFGRYQGRRIGDVPLNYLRWWKGTLIESLRWCSAEIGRREQLGLTEDEENQLAILPVPVRENLLRRLEACTDEDQRSDIHAVIHRKFEEYSPKQVSVYADRVQSEEDIAREDDPEES